MGMAIEFDPLIGGLQTVLDLRLQQHALTASNLANADTPGFKAKVIDFQKVLSEAVHGQTELRATDPRHLQPGGSDLHHDPPVLELEPPPWSLDGNSVLPERETARLTENAMMYDAVAKGLQRKLAMLRYAVSDGRG
jgi:flagellar basal-body rod protein FlgB